MEVALRWQSLGAPRLHIVDLDGAAAGEPQNLEVIRQIADASLLPTQLGGGIRTLETILVDGKLAHGNDPVLTMCAYNSTVSVNEAGWKKLDKRRSRGRIDGMISLSMACSVAGEILHERPVYSTPVDALLEDVG